MRHSAILVAAFGVLSALPAASAAQTVPAPAPEPEAAPEPNTRPAAGRMTIDVRGGLATRKLRYVARGQRVVVVGSVRPFVAGQVAALEVRRRGRMVARRRARIRRAGRRGRVVFRFKARRSGLLRVRARHARSAEQRAFKSRRVRLKAARLSAGSGARGTGVLLLQRGLDKLGFAVPRNGVYDAATERAVLAYRKTNLMGADGFASAAVFSAVFRGRGAFRARFPRAGRHVEFDWSRQVLALMDGGRARNVYHASSGTASTPTVFGGFRFYRKQPGTNSSGMVHSNYFIRGYAIHGYPSVPNYPASHGCIRVPIPNALQIDRQISLGDQIFVYE